MRRAFYRIYCFFSFAHSSVLLDKDKVKAFGISTAKQVHPHGCYPTELLQDFEKHYSKLKGKKEGRIDVIWALLRLERVQMAFFFLLQFTETIIRLAAPFVLREFLIWIEDYRAGESEMADGWKWGVLLSLSPFLYMLLHHRMYWLGAYAGYRMRIALMAAIHAKILSLNTSCIAQKTAGHVINLLSTDLCRLDNAALFGVCVIFGPLECIAVLISTAAVLGILPAIAGMTCLLLIIPIQSVLAKHIARWRDKIAGISDKRIELTREIISGNLAVKMLGWENSLIADVSSVRSREHRLLVIKNTVAGAKMTFPNICHVLVVCATFVTYRFTNDEFHMPDVFFALSLMSLPRLSMSFLFLMGAESLSESYITCKRADAFLKIPDSQKCVDTLSDNDRGQVKIAKGAFGWYVTQSDNPDSKSSKIARQRFSTKKRGSSKKKTIEPELRKVLFDINLDVKPGELVGIAGAVGSGKSSLLCALLNDMENLSAIQSRSMSGKVAYAAQTPWIMAGTVRENIIMGKPFEEDLYNQVIASCALKTDLQQFPNGDDTEIGERGINISGGQKARLALARAAYSQADIYLLDDPLSAVDPKVGRILFERCLGPEGIMRNGTRVLVTHQRQFLPFCDRVVVMEDGTVSVEGKWKDIADQTVISAIERTRSNDTVRNIHHVFNRRNRLFSPVRQQKEKATGTADNVADRRAKDCENLIIEDKHLSSIADSNSSDKGQLVAKEGKEEGRVAFQVYWQYAKHVGLVPLTLSLVLIILSITLLYLSEWWVASWATASVEEQKDLKWIWVLISLTAASAITHLIGAMLLYVLLMNGSTRLHRSMLRCVMHAPLRFFHTNPTGRIVNRFAKDMGLQDEELVQVFTQSIRASFQRLYLTATLRLLVCSQNAIMLLGAFVLVTIALPYMIVFLAGTMSIFAFVVRRYVRGSREIKRYDGVSTSPVYAMITANIKGLATIRAFKAEAMFHDRFVEALDLNGSWWTAFLMTSRWLGFRLDGFSGLVLSASTILAILLAKDLPPEVLGLALTQIITFSGILQWTLRQLTELENAMTAVERNLEYTRLEQEPPSAVDGGGEAPKGWPSKGVIVYDSVTASYRTGLDPVLKNLSFTIPGGSSVGIVGRTGSGKSSLLLTLFRLIDVNEGTIKIDGIDAASIGIDVLRKPLAVIPQDPVLFGGTVRSNMDRWNNKSDARIWDVLRQVCLDTAVTEVGGLDATIAESGSNFSVGQRQLFCLARALLAEAKILALDEATANVDRTTDELIQKSLRSLVSTRDKTLLIIAHRLDTIMDCDQILVLDDGQLVEFGSPQTLIEKKAGVFAGMVAAAKKTSD